MFDVLVYLYENYFRPDACPDADTLARKLSAAGFEGEEIDDALSWLSGLATTTESALPMAIVGSTDSFRVFAELEYERLGPECIGFLSFLCSAGVLTPTLREIVIDRALATEDTPVPLDQFKIIVLMVLWSQGEEPDALVLEELLDEGEPPSLH